MLADLLELLRQVAQQTTEAGKPADWMTGTVVQEKPLVIQVDSKLVLPAALLTVPLELTDHTISVTPLGWKTAAQTCTTSHLHEIPEEQVQLLVHAALKQNERVYLLRKPGGQNFLVLGRVVPE